MLRRLVMLLALVAALPAWAVLSDLLNGRSVLDALPWVEASLAFGFGIGVGLLAVAVGARVTGAVAFGVLVVLLVAAELPGGVSGSLGDMLAYPNAMAALAVQVGAVCLLAGTTDRVHRAEWFALGVAAVAVTGLLSASAGFTGGVLLLAVGGWATFGRDPGAQWVTPAAGIVLLGATLVQVVLTAVGSWPPALANALSSRRVDLWDDAWTIAATRPWVGRGPGAFVELSPTAADPDTTTAHSILLQVFAELGLVGVSVVVGIAVAGFVVLGTTPPRVRLIAVVAWAAVWLHGLVDYVMDFPVVVFAVGAMVGVALWAGRPIEGWQAPA